MMASQQRPRRRVIAWAIVGAVVLAAGAAGLLVGALSTRDPSPPDATSSRATTPTATTPSGVSSAPPANAVVDPDVTELGWVPEPITTDPETYVRAALAAAATFDTTRSSRDELLDYLDTWFTPDTRYTEADRGDRMDAAKLELRQSVVLPESMWSSMVEQKGRVVATVAGEVAVQAVPNDDSGTMRIGTADVVLTFTQQDGTGAESSYTEDARVSVQILCGDGSVPTRDSAQRAGDCKVVRYFTEPVES